MARPGVQVVVKAAPPSGADFSASGMAFFAGITERGRTDKAVLIHNMDEFVTYFGNRVSYGVLYDACDAFFRSGGGAVYVGRVVGPAATAGNKVLNDAGAAASLTVSTKGPNTLGWTVQVVAGAVAGTAHLVVADATGAVLTTSPDFAAPTDFAAWSINDPYINVAATGANVPAVAAAAAFSAGNDDRVNITDAVKNTAMTALFPSGLGIGQLAYPGATTTAAHVNLLNLAQNTGRVALLDMPDTNVAATITAEAVAIRASGTKQALAETYGIGLAGWQVVAGITPNTTRSVPPSPVAAALIAKSDAQFGNPNLPAAGNNGVSAASIALTQPDWIDSDRQALNDAGIAVFRTVYGNIELYGYRTLSDPTVVASAAWDSFSAARLRMALVYDLTALGEAFMFDQLDGKGQKIAEFGGAVAGQLQTYWARGALYGDNASESYSVDVGPSVNTPATINNKELHAKVGIRTSPFAELTYFEVTKVPVTQSL